jgi:hypothetical protein
MLVSVAVETVFQAELGITRIGNVTPERPIQEGRSTQPTLRAPHVCIKY